MLPLTDKVKRERERDRGVAILIGALIALGLAVAGTWGFFYWLIWPANEILVFKRPYAPVLASVLCFLAIPAALYYRRHPVAKIAMIIDVLGPLGVFACHFLR